jgi:putative membrane protein
MSTLFAFLHHLFAFTLVAALAVELMLIHQELTVTNARRLLRADAVLGISAGLLLIVGASRMIWFEKGIDYYTTSYPFLIKLGVFLGLAVMSAMPTAEFLSWRKALRAGQLPAVEEKRRRMIQATIHGELMGVVVILLCAAMAARGGWV